MGLAFTDESTIIQPFPTDADFSGKAGFAVTATASDMALSASGDIATGALPEEVKDWSSDPTRQGNPVQGVIVFGAAPMVLGGTVSGVGRQAGAVKPKTDGSGEWVACTGATASGWVYETGVDGDMVRGFIETFEAP